MAMPKKRMSHARSGKRRSHIALKPLGLRACAQCKQPTLPHRVCANCGYYRGEQIIKKVAA